MDSNYSSNGNGYSQQSESVEQSMEHTDEKGVRKPGERIFASKEQEDDKKIFVGGLAWDTTTDSLRKYFSTFGEVLDIDIKKDPVSNKPRGFGFVLFGNGDSAARVLSHQDDHKVDGKTVDPKPANPLKKPEKKKKIFIGGIGADVKDESITEYFSSFGSIVETEFPEDKNTGRRLGFAFVTFESSDEAQAAQKERFHHIGGKKVEVTEAVSREERQQQKMRGVMGFRGKGRGAYGPGYGRGGSYGAYGGYDGHGGGGGGGYYSGYGQSNWGGGGSYGHSHGQYGGAGYSGGYGGDYGPGGYGQSYGGYGDFSYGSGGGYSGGGGGGYGGGYGGSYGGGGGGGGYNSGGYGH